jgi:hypothetical protein
METQPNHRRPQPEGSAEGGSHLLVGGAMPSTYEISGALSVKDHFRHVHAQRFAETIASPANVYFATDAVAHALVLRIRGALNDTEVESIESAVAELSQKWARAGAIFQRVRYGVRSFVPVGLVGHLDLLVVLADEQTQLEAILRRQARILEQFMPSRRGLAARGN